jgi:hypothetical protein
MEKDIRYVRSAIEDLAYNYFDYINFSRMTDGIRFSSIIRGQVPNCFILKFRTYNSVPVPELNQKKGM